VCAGSSEFEGPYLAPSDEVLGELGYDYLFVEEGPSTPELAEVTFGELVPEFARGPERARALAPRRLYRHQLEALNALAAGANVVLVSGTGSGKTESWAVHAIRGRLRVLAVYPTLALSQDQIDRLRSYYSAVGLPDAVVEVDRPVVGELGYGRVREALSRAYVVVTNPAFLMAELKRLATPRGRAVLGGFLRDVDLVVLDELDYYGSRRATLLLAMVELLERYVCRRRPQVVVLAATLGNPDEVARYLTGVNGRRTEVIEGRAFRVANRVYAVLGKNLRRLWEYLRGIRDVVESAAPELLPALEDFDTFRLTALDVVESLRAAGVRVPELELDAVEVLAEYVRRDEGYVTVVFTPSIRSAEVLARRLRERLERELGGEFGGLVAVHHHLVDPARRRDIEERARRGRVRVVFTVRTLLQGVDIGTIARVVHYGLPEDIREFRQREGRKGRRLEIPFSETVIFPVKPMDRVLLELGLEGLREYVSAPLERVFVNPSNKYVLLFKALVKLRLRPEDLTPEERGLLEGLGLVTRSRGLLGEGLTLSDEGRTVWNHLGFYEFGPPYGVVREVSYPDGRAVPLGEVSWRDLVEKYQPGCFDYSTDAVVVDVRRGAIVEEDLATAVERWDFLAEAYERYYALKLSWREEPDLLRDLASGRLTAGVSCYVRVPRRGFGVMVEEPEAVIWEVESRRRRVVRRGGEVRVVRTVGRVQLNSRVYGRYRDFTYGYVYQLDPDEDTAKLRAGLALLKLALRLSDLRVPLNEVEYAVYEVPGKLMAIWEGDCSGVLESLDWGYVRRVVEGFTPSRLAELMLWAVDEEVAAWVAEGRLTWDEAREYALRALDYIQEVTRLRLEGLGVVRVPKPSRALGLLSLDLEVIKVGPSEYWVITAFDGDSYHQEVAGSRAEAVEELLKVLRGAIDEGVRVLTYGKVGLLEELAGGSRTLRILLEDLVSSQALIDVHREVREVLGVDLAPIEELERYLRLPERSVTLKKLLDSLHRVRTGDHPKRAIEDARRYGASNAYSTYLIHLVLTSVAEQARASRGSPRQSTGS
jgi:DEAD/DEAH box helicase domain-containing protein